MDIDDRTNQLTLNVRLLRIMADKVLAKIDKVNVSVEAGNHAAALTCLEKLIAPLVEPSENQHTG